MCSRKLIPIFTILILGFLTSAEAQNYAGLFLIDPGVGPTPVVDSHRKDSWKVVKARRFETEQSVRSEHPDSKSVLSSDLVLVNHFYDRYAYGSTYYVMAKVQNTGVSIPCFNKIYMDFMSSSGQALMSDWTYITGSNRTLTSIDSETDTCLAPGEIGFFGSYVDGPMGDVVGINYHFESTSTNTVFPDANIVVINGPNSSDSYGTINLSGSLRNSGNCDANFVKISSCLEASDGSLLDVDMTYVEGVTIGGTDTGLHPNQTGSFTMYTEAPSNLYFRNTPKTAWDDYGSATPCTYVISPNSMNFDADGGAGSTNVSTQNGCSWVAGESLSWVSISSGSSSTGNGTVHFNVATNSSSSSRSGNILVAGKTFLIVQEGVPSCTYSISPTSESFQAGGGIGTVTVNTNGGCPWTAASNAGWLSVTSGSGGEGSGTVGYRVDQNGGTAERLATILIAGNTFAVSQAGTLADTPQTQVLAGIAHNNGSGGSVWRSSVIVTNRSDEAAELTLTYHYNENAVSRSVTVQSGHLKQWKDVTTSLFDVQGGSSGSIEVSSNQPILVSARTFNDSGEGTFGQGLPSISEEDAMSDQDIGVLPGLTKTNAFRTNVGFVNLLDSLAIVKVRLYSKDGNQLGNSLNITIRGSRWVQENDIFQVADVPQCEIGYATLKLLTAPGLIWAYGSVVDNKTGDPTTIPLLID